MQHHPQPDDRPYSASVHGRIMAPKQPPAIVSKMQSEEGGNRRGLSLSTAEAGAYLQRLISAMRAKRRIAKVGLEQVVDFETGSFYGVKLRGTFHPAELTVLADALKWYDIVRRVEQREHGAPGRGPVGGGRTNAGD